MTGSNGAVDTAPQSPFRVVGIYDTDVAEAIIKLVRRRSLFPSDIVDALRGSGSPAVRSSAELARPTIDALLEQGRVRRTSSGRIGRVGRSWWLGFLPSREKTGVSES